MDVLELKMRVRELEEKVEQLRLSRRVLICLIEKMEKERVASLVHPTVASFINQCYT